MRSERADYRQEHLPWGYKELTIAPDASGDFAFDPGALHIWPRGDSMMIALPNRDHSFTATLFWPFDGPVGFAGLDDPPAVRARFDRDYPDATELFDDLAGEFARNPVGSLVTVRVWPWVRGRLALLGDAAHAIVPFFGQGMNCAFEDVVELDRCLAESADEWGKAMAMYAERRKPNADAIAELALDNFVEMRDKVGSRDVPVGQACRARRRALGAASISSRCTSWSASRPSRTPRRDGGPGSECGGDPHDGVPGHAGRCWPLPRWRSLARIGNRVHP